MLTVTVTGIVAVLLLVDVMSTAWYEIWLGESVLVDPFTTLPPPSAACEQTAYVVPDIAHPSVATLYVVSRQRSIHARRNTEEAYPAELLVL